MKSIKSKFATAVLTAIILLAVSCKKDNVTPNQSTREKLLGKWNWVSEVTNDYYNGASHITTYNFQPGDYFEFKNDGKLTEFENGFADTYDYGIIDDSKIWMVYTGNIYAVKILTASDLQLYKKDVSGTDYYESTLNLKR